MESFTIEVFTLLGVGIFVILFRLYARISKVGFRELQADDYLMVVAAISYAAETYLAYSVGNFWMGLANNGMTDEERRNLDPDSEEYSLRVSGSKTQIAGWSVYTFLLWVLKAAMCTFYLRLTDGLGYRKRIYTGFVLIVGTWLAVLFSILFGCTPMEKNWQIYPDPGNRCQPAISRINIFVTVVLNVLTDLYLLSVPVPMLWSAKLPTFKKLGLIVLFSGGIFVTMAGILRCVLILTDPVNGAQQAGSWAVRETFVAVITTNLPMIFPLLRRWLLPVFGGLSNTFSSLRHRGSRSGYAGNGKRSRSGGNGDVNGGSGSLPLADFTRKGRGVAPFSQYPLTNVTATESEERINGTRAMDGEERDERDGSSGSGSDIQKTVDFQITEESIESESVRREIRQEEDQKILGLRGV